MSDELKKAFAKKTLLASVGYIRAFIDKRTDISIEKIISASAKKLLSVVAYCRKRSKDIYYSFS